MNNLSRTFFCLALTVCSVRAATTYYVATTGSDANDGLSASAALATLSSALSKVHAGDTIQLGIGAFGGGQSYRDGLATAPICITGSGAANTVITGKLYLYHAFYAIKGLAIDKGYLGCMGAGCHNETITDCEFRRGVSGIYMQKGAGDATDIPDSITVSHCVFHHPTGDGMITIVGDNCTVTDCTFRDNSGYDAIRAFGASNVVRASTFTRIRSAADAIFSATSSSSANLAIGQQTFSIPAGLGFTPDDRVAITASQDTALNMGGFVVSYSGTDLVVDIDTVNGSGTATGWSICLASKGNHADIVQSFVSSFGLGTTNFTFEDNTVTDCTSQLGNLENDATNTVSHDLCFRNNVIINSRLQLNCGVPRVKFYNNTIFGTAGFEIGIRASYSTGGGSGDYMMVYNNLFIHVAGNGYGDGAYAFNSNTVGCSADYNIVTSESDGGFPYMTIGPNCMNGGITPTQLFTNPGADDLTLAVGSPAIDHGTALTLPQPDKVGELRPQGTTWDIGAFERIQVNNPLAQEAPIGTRVSRPPTAPRQ